MNRIVCISYPNLFFPNDSWHRGAAFNETGAPDRVMLILTWVPKPRSHTESRQIPHGITFSLRWDMWGHTWNDLMDGSASMKWPWTILRAFGLYKKSSADWGVDFVSSAVMRMTNSQIGFQKSHLTNFVKRDGGFKFLPSWLHGYVDENNETSWEEFLMDTLHRCKRFLLVTSFCIYGAYFGFGWNIDQGKGRLKWSILFVVALALTLYKAGITHVNNSQWASDLRHGIRYTSPFGNDESRFDGPTVLPHRNDVLIQTRYMSEYLALYNDVVGNHPGNLAWSEMIGGMTFVNVSSGCLGQAIATYIVSAIHRSSGRFLYQRDADWVELSKEDAITQTKEELIIKSNPIRERVLTELGYQLSEAKYGRYRGTVMSAHSLVRLGILRRKLLGFTLSSIDTCSSMSVPMTIRVRDDSNGHSQDRLPALGHSSTGPPVHRSTLLLAPTSSRIEPEPGVWLKTGDIIDAVDVEHGIMYWYKAQIDHVSSLGRFHVTFLGYEDEMAIVDRSYVRRYIPPLVGDSVEIEVGQEKYQTGIIVRKQGNDLFDVKVDREVLRNRNDKTFRRKDE